MTPRQQIFAIIAAISIVLIVFELVRRRKLREEYTWLWMLTAAIIFLVVIRHHDLLVGITHLIGAVLPTTTLFLFGILFLYLICLYYGVKMSALEEKVKKLAQEHALLEEVRKERLSGDTKSQESGRTEKRESSDCGET